MIFSMKCEKKKVKELLPKIIDLELTDPKITDYLIENHNEIIYFNFSQFIRGLNNISLY